VKSFSNSIGLAWAVIAMLPPLAVALLIARFAVNVPFEDEIGWAPLIVSLHKGSISFGALWAQHNDHRMLFGNLIALGLASLGGWSQLRECLASLAITVVGQLFLLLLLRATLGGTALVVFAIDSLLIFSLGQTENWLWGFQTVWFLINTCVFAVLFFLQRRHTFALAIAAAYVASFSSLFGLNAWPVGAISLVLTSPLHRYKLLLWSGFAILAGCLYFYGYEYLGHSTSGAEHAAAGAIVLYVLAYLGGALGRPGGVGLAVALGVLGLCGYSLSVGVALRRDTAFELRNRMAPWIALGAFTILSSILTAIGRAGLGVDQALSGRYVTPSSLLWIALVSLGFLASTRLKLRRTTRLAMTFSLYAGAVLFVIQTFEGLSDMRATYASRAADYDVARQFETATDDQLRLLFPSAEAARDAFEGLLSVGEGPAARGQRAGCPPSCR
jgi:hypothetical protein